MIVETADYGMLTGYPARIDPRTLEVGDVVIFATRTHMVMEVHHFENDPRFTVRVVWDDGESTLYSPRSRVQRAVLRESAKVCIVEASATAIP